MNYMTDEFSCMSICLKSYLPCLLRGDRRCKNLCFFGKVPKGGGGSFPIQKITLQILLVSKRYILGEKKAQCNFQTGRAEGGGWGVGVGDVHFS